MRAHTRTKCKRWFPLRKRRALLRAGIFRVGSRCELTHFERLDPLLGNRSSYFAGEPALTAGLIQCGHNVEVSPSTDHKAIFIWWARDLGGELHKLAAGCRASIDVVADDRDPHSGRRGFPGERNAVGRGFLTRSQSEAKQSDCEQEPEWGSSH